MNLNTVQRPSGASLLAVLLAAAVLPATMLLAATPQTATQESALRSQLAARAASTNPASAPTNNQPSASAQPLEFMPEIERVLPGTSALGERCYLDFESGAVAVERTAEDPRRNRQLHRDLKADLTPGAGQWTGIGLLLTPATDELWNATAGQVIAALADHLANTPPTLPVTRASWLFKTAGGTLGLMHEEGMVPTPGGGRGMKIVYKLAREARPAPVAQNDLPLRERMERFLAGQISTTGYALEIWEQGPNGEMRLRSDLAKLPIPAAALGNGTNLPSGNVYYLKSKDRFYIQWDGMGASTLHYYGPFVGDPVKVFGLPTPR